MTTGVPARRRRSKFNECGERRLKRGPEEIAGENYQRPADTGEADPDSDLAAMRPGRIFKLRKTPHNECAEPSQRMCICTTGHVRST